jgi:hypothetical protein
MSELAKNQKEMRTIKKISLALILLVGMMFIFQRCQKDIENETLSQQNIDSDFSDQLGRKLENPYTVKNMQKALNNLLGKSKGSNDSILPSHLYVKFIPLNEEELDRLDSLRYISEYPLDYEVIEGESSYRDPEVPEDQPTFQYTSVKIGDPLPDVNFEIIEELYIPEEDPNFGGKGKITAEQLVTEALMITNNLNDNEVTNSKWRPSGTIRVYDDIGSRDEYGNFLGNYIPLKGVKVEARRWFTVHTGFTDDNGYYSCDGTFSLRANYKIVWERAYYDIREGTFGQAIYNGPKKDGSWNLDIGSSSDTNKSMRYATIHRAAYRYHYDDIGGLRRPSVPSKLKICYFHETGTGVNWGNISGGIIPNILIYGKKSSNVFHSTNQLFSTTIHELGHASHINLMNGIIQYSQVDDIIYESWANCVEWFISKIEYNHLGNPNYDIPPSYIDNMQTWTNLGDHTYTPIFIDLIDDYNQKLGSSNKPDDRIKLVGNPHDIEIQIVKESYGLSSLRSNVKNASCIPANDSDIDLYFNFYNGY